MGSNDSGKLDDPVATALGSDTDSSSVGSQFMFSIESAKRTTENSPAIHRWDQGTQFISKSAKRTTEFASNLCRPFHGLFIRASRTLANAPS